VKRHTALQPFSREHHEMLLLAQLLKVDAPDYPKLPKTLNDKAKYAHGIFESIIKAHFEREEKLLFPLIAGINASIDGLLHVLIDDHAELVFRFETLAGEVNQQLAMHEVALLLEQHVRTEERVLFEQLQETLTPSQWKTIQENIKDESTH
jgi:iron-sulfur cluster repair protein YtfE (RIC family)